MLILQTKQVNKIVVNESTLLLGNIDTLVRIVLNISDADHKSICVMNPVFSQHAFLYNPRLHKTIVLLKVCWNGE